MTTNPLAPTDSVIVKHVGVDAGMIWVGDPCYVLGADASHRVNTWADFCGKVFDHGGAVSEPLGEGIGLAITSGYGDGWYEVTTRLNSDGRVASVSIEFIDDEDTDDDQYELNT